MSRTSVNYFRTECRMLREYLRRYRYYQLKVEELEHALASLHPAMTERVSSTTSYSMTTFDYDKAADRDTCEDLARLYHEKIKHILEGIRRLPIWIRPDFIQAYVMETTMKDIAENTGRHVVDVQKEFYTALSGAISDSWMYTDKIHTKKIDDLEKHMRESVRYRN